MLRVIGTYDAQSCRECNDVAWPWQRAAGSAEGVEEEVDTVKRPRQVAGIVVLEAADHSLQQMMDRHTHSSGGMRPERVRGIIRQLAGACRTCCQNAV